LSLSTTAAATATEYIFTVTDGMEENAFVYKFGKQPPEGQTLQEYLQNCKREAELLAQLEIDKKQPPQEMQI